MGTVEPVAVTPWMETEPIEGSVVVRVAWIEHSDSFRAGGRVGAHRGPCQRDGSHMMLWHLCSGSVVLAERDIEEMLDFPRWVVSLGPVLDGRKCCGMRGEVVDGAWAAAETVKTQ